MNIIGSEVFGFLEGKVQYQIPVYQRKYSWEEKNCDKLLEDIINVSKDAKREKHFMGSVIYLNPLKEQNATALKSYLVIDGQQRLTTISLLLIALGDYARETLSDEEYDEAEYSFKSLSDEYLFNRNKRDDTKYKLRPLDEDFKVYKQILESRSLPYGVESSQLYTNYKYLLNKMRSLKVPAEKIYEGLIKLALVDVSLVPEDNAQLVFETVNSTGMKLSVTDQIRNFIFMNAKPDDQEDLYNNYWHPMELSFGQDKQGIKDFDEFFRNYTWLILEGVIKFPKEYYELFKNYYLGCSKDDVKELIIKISDFSKYYRRWLECDNKQTDIDKAICNIKATGVKTAVLVVMQILNYLNNATIDDSKAKEMFEIVESYIIRRQLCKENTGGTTDAIASIKDNCASIKTIKECIIELPENQKMPTDREMLVKLRSQDVFGYKRIRFVLDCMEAHKNKDYIHNSKFSIEHIMPQTIQSHQDLYARTDYSDEKKAKLDWANDLGDNWSSIHEQYKNTIGNLTLTGYNSEYQNYRFLVKRDMADEENGKRFGYKYTPIYLSSSLKDLDKWGEDEILKRTKEMSSLISEIWKYPEIVAYNGE